MMNKDRLHYLFRCYYDKTATDAECDELLLYIEESNSDDDLLFEMKHLYNLQMEKTNEIHSSHSSIISKEKTDEILNSIISSGRTIKINTLVQRKTWMWQKIAASIFIIMLSGLIFWYFKPIDSTSSVASATKQMHIAPGGNKAVLTLTDGTNIPLDGTPNGMIASLPGIEILKTADGQLTYHITSEATAKHKNAYNTITTPLGGQYQVILPDGTKVWLNAASSLRYPVCFSSSERRVELDGEGYFEVAENRKVPFKVITKDQDVTVLGTHFNINSYNDEPNVITTVLEGSVKVSPTMAGNELKGRSEVLKMREQAVLDLKHKQVVVKEIPLSYNIAWKTGKFQFQNTHIAEVMRQLARWYNVDFRYEGKLPNIRLSGEVNRNLNAEEALEILKFFDLKYSVEEGSKSKKLIIIR